jgi:hypothetical protein
LLSFLSPQGKLNINKNLDEFNTLRLLLDFYYLRHLFLSRNAWFILIDLGSR